MFRGVGLRTARAIALAVLAAGGSASRPGPAVGQWAYGADLVALSRYEWRGLVRHDGWVLQPDLVVSYGRGPRITGGVLATVALSEPEGTGFDGWTLGEANPWVEASTLAGPLDVAAGWTGYFFDRDGARGPFDIEDTQELYLRASWIDLPLIVPRLAVFRDVQALRSWYAETRITLRVPVWTQVRIPLGSLFVTGWSGWAFGVDEPIHLGPQGGRTWGPREEGLVHWGLGLRLPIGPIELGPLTGSFQLAWHTDWKEDAAARLADADWRERSRASWWELSVSLLGPPCRAGSRGCSGS